MFFTGRNPCPGPLPGAGTKDRPVKPYQTPITRRRVLSLAVLTGAFVTLQPGLAQAAAPATTYPAAPAKALRSIAPGAGVKEVHPEAFVTVAYLDQQIVTNPAGIPKLLTSQSGMTSQFQVLDVATGKPDFVATTPVKISSNLAYNPATGTVYFGRGDGHLMSWKFGDATLADLGRVTPIATGVYAINIAADGKIWGGSYPQGLIWTYAPATGVFTDFPRIDADTDYVRGLALAGTTVYAGTASINPKMISFPASDPTNRTVIALPDAGASGFVSQITARGEKLFVFAEDSKNVTRGYVYNLRTKAWEGIFPGGSPTKYFTGTETDTAIWGIQSGNIISINTTTMARTILAATGMSSPRSIHTIGDKLFVAGVDGTDNVITEFSISSKTQVKRCEAQSVPGALAVQSLIAGTGGLLYLGGYQGNGLASLNPDTGVRWQGPEDSGVNQIEHLFEYDADSIFIGSYGSAKLYRYTPSLKATGKGAFTLIANLRTECMQSRPFGWAAAAGKVIVGTVPEYGHNGGALGIIDPATSGIEVMDNFIDGRSIVGLHGAGDIVYGTTSNKGGYGAPDYVGPSVVFAYNVRARTMQWSTELDYVDLYSPLLIGGELVVSSINGIIVLDPSTGKPLRTSMIRSRTAAPGYLQARTLRIPGTRKIVHNSGGIVTLIDLEANTRSELANGPHGTQTAVTTDGRLFVSTGSTGIAELHTTPNQTLKSPADLVSISAAGELVVEASTGRGAFMAPVNHGGAWDRATLVSFHVVDWNGDGVSDILAQRTDGSLQLHRGRVGGGFDAPVPVAPGGWSNKAIAVGMWNRNRFTPAVLAIDPDGTISASQVDSDGTLGAAVVLGSGWGGRQIVLMDMDANGVMGLVARDGATLIHQDADGLGKLSGAETVVASAGWSDVTQLTGLLGHYSGKTGLVSVSRLGSMRYISSTGTGFAGIINYTGDRSGSLLAGTRKF